MISLQNDYSEGAHPQILKRLAEINAAEKIRQACACPEADIFFLVGGTQTNQVVIDTMLAPYEGVVAACTGHVSTHEAGAIEFTGHKVLELPQHEGKIEATELQELVSHFWQDGNHEHMVFPGMVPVWSISPTLLNTVRCTVKENWKPLPGSATNIRCRYIWTEPAWHTG